MNIFPLHLEEYVYSFVGEYEREFVYHEWYKIPEERAWQLAIEHNHMPLCIWLREPNHRTPWSADYLAYAVAWGRREIVEWLRDPDQGSGSCPWDACATFEAANVPDEDLFYWLVDPDTGYGSCPINPAVIEIAAAAGSIPILEYIYYWHPHRRTCFGDYAIIAAMINGQTETVQWLIEKNV
jgi:hypothetical protein